MNWLNVTRVTYPRKTLRNILSWRTSKHLSITSKFLVYTLENRHALKAVCHTYIKNRKIDFFHLLCKKFIKKTRYYHYSIYVIARHI